MGDLYNVGQGLGHSQVEMYKRVGESVCFSLSDIQCSVTMTIMMILLVCIYIFKSLRACVLPTNLWQGNYWSVLT